jgi:hypothetical protein
MEYSSPLRGDAQQATRPVPGREQRRALALLAGALEPRELAIPDTVLTLMVPNASAVTPQVELFGSRTRPAFDELGAARTLAQMVVDAVLQRDRAARLVQFAHRGPDMLTLAEAIDSLVAATWERPAPADRKLAALQRVAGRAVADRLLRLAADEEAAPEVRAMAELRIAELRRVAEGRSRVRGGGRDTDAVQAHWLAIAVDFRRWMEERVLPPLTPSLVSPPGDPF